MSDTQGSEGLAALGTVTRETDAANPDQATVQQREQLQVEEAQAEEGAQQWGQIMFLFGGAVTMVAPELKPVYAEARCLTWGKAANEVAKKYEWDAPALPELTLAACSMSFVIPTFLVLREKAKEIKDARNAGVFGRLVLWWRARKGEKAGQVATSEPAANVSQQ